MTDPRGERIWERGWEGHADAQARRMAAFSLAEKLDWLEEAHARARHLRSTADSVSPADERPRPAPGTRREEPPGAA